jgi:predicted acylesterase/phospholipase RssA
MYHRALTLGGLLGPRYANDQKIALANEIYADAHFRDLLLPVMVPSYSVKRAGLQLFTNWSPQYAEMFVAPLVSAATSAPIYFPGVELDLPSGSGVYMDGGVLDADPAQAMYLPALEHFPAADVVLVSLGTGVLRTNVNPQAGERGGLLTWLVPLMGLAVDGRGDLASTWLDRFSKTKAGEGLHYYRFDIAMPDREIGFDDASPETVASLRQLGQSLVEQEKDRLDELIGLLTNP